MSELSSLVARRDREFLDAWLVGADFPMAPTVRRLLASHDGLLARVETLEAALGEIAEHPVISEGEFPDDNCDWHCAAEITSAARAALAPSAAEPPEPSS